MTFRIDSMDSIPDWLWHTSDASDWLGQGIVSRQGIIEDLVAASIILGLGWALNHREEIGEFSNNLRYRLTASPTPGTETVDALPIIGPTSAEVHSGT